ncbi:MAG: CRISPR-associated helicase Cas3', partial [Planctomycetota bacterium]|nr:CRISPR-associated helicase Cas3' [Planctomycetota bacterium]
MDDKGRPFSFTDRLDLLWAKSSPRHPLWKHLLDTAAISLALPNPVASFGWLDEQTALMVGLHDIGKADSSFQHQEKKFSEELAGAGFPLTADARCRHERLSASFMRKKLECAGLDPFTASAIARCVAAHHGYWDEAARDVHEAYSKAQDEMCHMLENVLEVNDPPMERPSDLSAFGMRLTGHIVLCDWIASNEKFFTDDRLQELEIDNPTAYFAKSKEIAGEWIEKLSLERDQSPGKPAHIVETPRPIQRAILDQEIPPGLVIIEAPMGEGKTEAAWILAEKWRSHGYHGMYMALPTMATSDSLHQRYHDDYLKKLERGKDAKLVHGMAWLRDEQELEKPPNVGEPGDDRSLAAAWFRPTRKAMLAAHGVGTVDQAMLAGMHVKFGFLRLYGLADRVLVIDEVHAYDAYMSAIIARLLQWCACLKIPVILLSATLSAKQRAAMIEAYGATGGDPGPDAAYPLITVVEPKKPARSIAASASICRTLRIETLPDHIGKATSHAKKTAGMAEKLVEQGGCCCIILNTVKQAQAVYQELKLDDNEKLLFHARFTAADREKITNRVLGMFGKESTCRPQKFVLVATQVVEQSLDVDFDHMISEIAPIDLLLQRSGRIKRHARDKHGKLKEEGGDERGHPALHVLLPKQKDGEWAFGGTGYVYAAKPLFRTLAIISGGLNARLPDDFRQLIERCYGQEVWVQDVVAWDAIRKADEDWENETQLLHSKGRQFALKTPNRRFF